MHQARHEGSELVVRAARIEPGEQDYVDVTVETNHGDVATRYYPAPGAHVGVIWVGGVGGGWDTPAGGLYPRLGGALSAEGICSLRVRFRDPRDLHEAVLDVLAGIRFLESEGVEAVALVGHSFGGAVVVQAADASPRVRTVITLAAQSYGADAVSRLGPRCSLLFIHGAQDPILPTECSRYLHALAHEPKRLVLMEEGDHVLDSVADAVTLEVRSWIRQELTPGLKT